MSTIQKTEDRMQKGDRRRHKAGTAFCLLYSLVFASQLGAQTVGEAHLRRLLSVPLGALPPLAMLMPASRNHNYWVGRFQMGTQRDNLSGDLTTAALGLDFQWRGGSAFGLTGGYQSADCEENVIGCNGHALFGARARFNVVTGGPTFAALVGDNSATTTLGAEFGAGYAPNAIAGRNACAVDMAAPLSISLFQRIRLLSYFTPGIAWDVRCPVAGSERGGASTFIGAGIGWQQMFGRALDLSFGAQRFMRRGAGIQLGVNITYVRLP
jgi:hypothetical protein